MFDAESSHPPRQDRTGVVRSSKNWRERMLQDAPLCCAAREIAAAPLHNLTEDEFH